MHANGYQALTLQHECPMRSLVITNSMTNRNAGLRTYHYQPMSAQLLPRTANSRRP